DGARRGRRSCGKACRADRDRAIRATACHLFGRRKRTTSRSARRADAAPGSASPGAARRAHLSSRRRLRGALAGPDDGAVSRLLLSLVLTLFASACTEERTPPASEGEAPVRVEVMSVQRGPIAERIEVPGETAARVSLRLTSPVAGRVTFLPSLPGDRIPAG